MLAIATEICSGRVVRVEESFDVIVRQPGKDAGLASRSIRSFPIPPTVCGNGLGHPWIPLGLSPGLAEALHLSRLSREYAGCTQVAPCIRQYARAGVKGSAQMDIHTERWRRVRASAGRALAPARQARLRHRPALQQNSANTASKCTVCVVARSCILPQPGMLEAT